MSNRNMDNLDLLSNDELRLRLVQYGFQNLPVTSTTRKVLIKKLRTYMDNEKSKLRRETSYATRYSSGEESDDARNNNKKNNRATVSAIPQATSTFKPSMPPPASRSIKRGSISTANNHQPKSLSPQNRSSVYISPVIINDSEEENDYSPRNDKNNSSSTFGTSARTIQRLLPSNDSPGSLYKKINYSPSTSTNHTTSQFLNESTNTNGSATTNLDSPYLSEYTKRLLQLRGETVNNENNSHNSNNNNHTRNRSLKHRQSNNHQNSTLEFNENDIVTHAEPSPEPRHIPLQVALGNLINKLDEHYGFKQTFIPCILLCLFITFILFVTLLYLTISPDITYTLNSINTHYDLCESHQQDRLDHCIDERDIKTALDLLKITATELHNRVEYNKCKDSSTSYIMSADDVMKFAIEKVETPAVWQLMRDLHNMEYLINKNPQWRINHVDSEGNPITFDDVITRRVEKSNCFAILKPKLPFTCMIYNKFHTFFIIVGVLGIIGIVTYLINYFIQFVIFVKQKRKDRVNNLINEITNAVMEQAAKAQNSGSEKALVVVNHLRDSLIPPLERKQLEWAWVQAIKFLEHNDSRIQFEIGSRSGEDYKMMRWIDTISPSMMSSRPQVKKWQSPAFDKSNKIKDPPTQCLKIRQMFEKFEVNDPNLKIVVQDAILEKVGVSCKIYDIQLDRNTCCVYVRCASTADAGIVHDEINGWWFDNRLVSIKFLRVERYVSRFPGSMGGPKCLRPSNRNNSSMSQQDFTNNNDDKSAYTHNEDDDDDDGEDD